MPGIFKGPVTFTNLKNIKGETFSIHVNKDGTIAPVACDSARMIDGKGLTALPGFIDMQVHVRSPGQTHKEDIYSASLSAVRGGFCRMACMPNTRPTLDNPQVISELQTQIESLSLCPIDIIAAMTKGLGGDELAPINEYRQLGLYGITDDGRGVQRGDMMEQLFKRAKDAGLSIMQHCEVEDISHHAPIHEGVMSKTLQLSGQPGEAEFKMVERDLELLAKYGGHYHVLHASSAQTVELVRAAKKAGLKATMEVTPHHLLLCDEDIPHELDPNFKMNPPLRSRADQAALVEAFLSGDIDIVSTDHAPHTEEEKRLGFEAAPFGIIGLESAFPLLYTNFVKTKRMTLETLVQHMSLNVSKLFPIPSHALDVGNVANFTLVDLDHAKTLLPEESRSKSRNSPFWFQKLYGFSHYTIVNGVVHGFEDRWP
jgi:dihydroorotase